MTLPPAVELLTLVLALGLGLGLLIVGLVRLSGGRTKPAGEVTTAVALVIAGLLCGTVGAGLVILVPNGRISDLWDWPTFTHCGGMGHESTYTHIGFEQLGDYLGRNYPKSKAVLITSIPYPTADPYSRDNMILAALTKGIAGRLDIIATHDFAPPPAPANQPYGSVTTGLTPPAPAMTAADWDALLKEHPEATLIISLAGLPKDLEPMQLWQMPDSTRPKLALVNMEQLSTLYPRIATGRINVVLHPNPSAPYDPKREVPDDPQVAFNDRWLLITPANVAQMDQDNKGLFITPIAAPAPSTAAAVGQR